MDYSMVLTLLVFPRAFLQHALCAVPRRFTPVKYEYEFELYIL